MNEREIWRQRRARLETLRGRSSVVGRRRLPVLRTVLHTGAFVARMTGVERLAKRRKPVVAMSELDIACVGLPPSFDGFTIIHVSDPHLETAPALVAEAALLLRRVSADIAVLTGDYQSDGGGFASVPERAADLLRPLLDVMRAPDGVYGILGNHDSHLMVAPLEALGIRMLLNEHVTLRRGADELHIVGLDDLHAFYTEAAELKLHEPLTGSRILLAHTPELAGAAAEAGFDLYLAGHTHGGQICLPGGRPLFTGLDVHNDLASGLWRLGPMHGYTNRGLGMAAVPFRINCPAEIALIRLRAAF